MGELEITFGAALVGALSAYIFNRLHWREVRSSGRKEQYAMAIVKIVDELGRECVSYWTKGSGVACSVGAMNDSERINHEVRITSLFRALISNSSPYLQANYNQRDIQSKQDGLDRLLGPLFEAATGGEFEQVARNCSKHQASESSRLCSEIQVYFFRSLSD